MADKKKALVLDDDAQRIFEELGGLESGPLRRGPGGREEAKDPSAPRGFGDLDEDAQRLFSEIGGLDSDSTASDLIETATGLAKVLSDEAKTMDGWRVVLVDLAQWLAECLSAERTDQPPQDLDAGIQHLGTTLKTLSRMPDNTGRVLIRYRGVDRPDEGEIFPAYDYVIMFGNLILDIPTAKALSRRDLATLSEVPTRLRKAYEKLAALGINTIHLSFGAKTPEAIKQILACARTLCVYFAQVGEKGRVVFDDDLQTGPPPLVENEFSQPDPNLTMLANLNNFKLNTMKALVAKVAGLINQAEAGSALDQFTGVFESIFAVKSLRAQIKKPPVEVNNIRWLLESSDIGPAPKKDVKLARTVSGLFSHDPVTASRIVEALYGRDYEIIDPRKLLDNLKAVSRFLDRLEEEGGALAVEQEVLRCLESRMDKVRFEVLDRLSVTETQVEARTRQGRASMDLNKKLCEMLVFYQARAETKTKISRILNEQINFDDRDYATVAMDFEISVMETKRLLDLLQGCFIAGGRYQRSTFETYIPQFAEYGEKVFEFLWHYLKEAMRREDRVAFLNSLQLLIDQIQQPREVLLILLKDWTLSPESVTFFGRNGIMLANILIRTYNKELRRDLNATPKEVLQIQEGLNLEATRAAADFIDREQERFFQQVRAIHMHLKASLNIDEEEETAQFPANYILTFEREVFIFLSLVGGIAAHAILRSVVKEFGDPDSEIYRLRHSRSNMIAMIENLEISARGLARFHDRRDAEILQEVVRREKAFLDLSKEPAYGSLVRRVMRELDARIQELIALKK